MIVFPLLDDFLVVFVQCVTRYEYRVIDKLKLRLKYVTISHQILFLLSPVPSKASQGTT